MYDNVDSRMVATYVMDRTRHVIDTFGPRPPGSVGEWRAQELVREELLACCDGEVELEEFEVAQKAFFSMQAIGAVLTLAAFGAYWWHPAAGLAFAVAAVVVMYNQLLRYRLFLDPFFPKKPSHNVAGRQRPKGEMKRRLILNAHPDAAYEWRYNYLVPKLFPLIVLYTLLGLLVTVAATALATVLYLLGVTAGGWAQVFIGGILAVFAPGAVLGLFFNNFNVVADGANDNLSGVFIATGILKHLRAAGVQLEHTELMAVITGSEEAGLRGAKVWAAKHKAACEDVETIVIALDTFGDLPFLTIYNRDMNGTVAHDQAVCDLLKRAGLAVGRELPFGSIHLGSSDGSAFTQAGFRAAALCAMDPHPAHYYHNRRDTLDAMSPECITESVKVLVEAIRMYDAEGLSDAEGCLEGNHAQTS